MSVENLASLFDHLVVEPTESLAMDPNQLQCIIQSAVSAALQAQQESMKGTIDQLKSSIRKLQIKNEPPKVEEFVDCVIDRSITCDEGLDVVKCLPEFSGNKKEYLTFRRAAENAYKIFEPFDGSTKHYQAVSIIRNKIKGQASDKLTGFGTAFNFRAIIARLDNEYGDKRPIHLLEQELSTLRQGNMCVAEYYDEVQIKLTALTNKCLMQYSDKNFAMQLNDKYRRDAFRVFISGLKKGLSETLFSSRPNDLPSALALAEELESNKERYLFAARFEGQSSAAPTKAPLRADFNRSGPAPPQKAPFQSIAGPSRANNPNYVRKINPDAPEPMAIDPSIRAQLSRRTGNHWKGAQGVNLMYQEALENNLHEIVDGEEEYEVADNVNFLGGNPGSSS